jgi:hypothetical protein
LLTAKQTSFNPELKLENQGSMSSIFNDPNANANTVASVTGSLDGTGATVYDFEEGIRKHTKQIYGPILSVLAQ